MDYEFEKIWNKAVEKISTLYGEKLDYTTILFLIGVQELKQDFRKFTKNEKVDLIHIGMCSILAPYGYYTFSGKDKDGWPHFERSENLPRLSVEDQEKFVKQAIMKYFEEQNLPREVH